MTIPLCLRATLDHRGRDRTWRDVRQHPLDGGPFKIAEFVAHDSKLLFRSLNHVSGSAINPSKATPRAIRDGSSKRLSRCDTVRWGEPCVMPIRQLPRPCCAVDRSRGGYPRFQGGWAEPPSPANVAAPPTFFRVRSTHNPPPVGLSGKPVA